MLVIEDKQLLAFKSANPDEVTAVIPSARAKGNVVLVPHRQDEVRVLRNLGYSAPAPILSYYKWAGRYPPYEHQKLTAAFITMNRRSIVLNDIGTGKSLSAGWAFDYLMDIGEVKRALVVSPLSTLERVWGDMLFQNFYRRKYNVLYGTAEKRKRLLKLTDVQFDVINHDGLAVVFDDIQGLFDAIIVDEAAVLRNPSTTRFKTIRKYMDAFPKTRLVLMTGTPTPNEPTDAWSLAKLVRSPKLTRSYTGFRDEVMMKAGQWKFVPRPNSPEIVADILQPSIRFTREECLDLPDTVYQTREAAMSAEQATAFKAMVKHLVVEAKSGAITAANEAVKLQKLVQILCGVAYDEDGNAVELDCAPRIKVLLEALEQAGGKALVFVPLTGVLHMLHRELSKHYTVGVINGDVPATKRAEIFRDFQDDKYPQIIAAHPATMAHGLTLTSASHIVWYGPITSNEQYVQANGRIERIGKNRSSVVTHIEASALERKMYARLQGKQKLQGVLLDILGENT